MATIQTNLVVNDDPAMSRENTRKVLAATKKALPAYRYWGDTDDEKASDIFIKDWDIPTPVDTAEMQGVLVEADVPKRVAKPTRTVNAMQSYVTESQVQFNIRGAAIPGNYGNLSKQEVHLMERAMEVVNLNLLGNFASVKPVANTKGVCGSPITFLGDRTNNRGNNDFIVWASQTPVLTNAGGYNAATQETTSIQDGTLEDNRGDPTPADIIKASGRIYHDLDAAGTTRGRLRDMSFAAFIPDNVYDDMFNTDTSGELGKNRFAVSIGGNVIKVVAHYTQIAGPYGTITVFPVTRQLANHGTNYNNKMVQVWSGLATEVVYKVRPYTWKLNATKVTDQAAIRMHWTCWGPHKALGAAVLGLHQ